MFVELKNAHAVYLDGDRQITEIRLGREGAFSVKLHDPWSDWRSYETLLLDLEYPSDAALPLTIRVHDEAHLRGDPPHRDRFNRRIELMPGRHEIDISLVDIASAPANRNMDLSRIDGLVLFGSITDAGARFLIHGIRLERSRQ